MPHITIGKSDDGACQLDIPRLIASRALVTADSGGGKSYLLRKILEETSATTQTIVIDPEGEFASLREIRDMVLVGPDGELAAEPASAGLLARRLIELHLSAVINIEELELKAKQEFVANFCTAIVGLPRSLWHPCIIAIDEIHDFAPEQDKSISGSAVASLSSKGRKRGYCLLGATQRLAKLANDVAAGLKNNFLGTFSLDTDIKRAAGILGFGKDRWGEIRDLSSEKGHEGQFYAFGPALNHRGVKKIRGGQVRTTHPEPGMGRKLRPPEPSAAIKKFLKELKEIPAEARKQIEDLTEAKKRIRELEQRDSVLGQIIKIAHKHNWNGVENSKILATFIDQALSDAKNSKGNHIQTKGAAATIAKLRSALENAMKVIAEIKATGFEATGIDPAIVEKAIRAAADQIARAAESKIQDQRKQFAKLRAQMEAQLEQMKKILSGAVNVTVTAKHNEPFTISAPAGAPIQSDPIDLIDGQDTPLDKNPDRRIIGSLAWWKDVGVDAPTLAQIGVMSGYNPGGGSFTTYLSNLASAGVITRGKGSASLCAADESMIPKMPERSLQALHRRLIDQLDGPHQKIMRAIISKHGSAYVPIATLGEDSGYNAGGGSFGTYLSQLSSRGLIDRSERGKVAATSAVFPPQLT